MKNILWKLPLSVQTSFKNIRPIFFRIIPFLLPLALWCLLFRDFLSSKNSFVIDGFGFYGMYKYFFNNILNGVFPLWDPYTFMGRPFYLLATFGFFNPVNYLMLLSKMVGLDYLTGYMIMIVTYLFIGHIGFYLLCRTLLKDKFLAYLGYLAMLFSGVSAIIFNQTNMLMMYVPGVWFFYFLIRFSEGPHQRYVYAMTFCAMIMMTSYLPLYFITFFLFFIFTFLILYPGPAKILTRKYAQFFKKNLLCLLICVFSLTASTVPAFIYKSTHPRDEIVNPQRQCTGLLWEECFNRVMDHSITGPGELTYKETVVSGTLGERVSFHQLFSHLDKVQTDVDDLFFLPVFVYLIIAVSILIPVSRLSLLLALLFAEILLLSLGQATPFSKFLYDRIPYFHFLRNYFFFMVFLMPLMVLFALHQLKSLLTIDRLGPRQKKAHAFIIIIAHIFAFAFLMKQGYILEASYATVAVSALILTAAIFNPKLRDRKLLPTALILLVIAQPLIVFYHYNKNGLNHCQIPREHVRPVFHYLRPAVMAPPCLSFYSAFFYHNLTFQDDSGSPLNSDSSSRYGYYLFYKLTDVAMAEYIHYKFLLYDRVKIFDESREDINQIRPTFESLKNEAYVSDGDDSMLRQFDERIPGDKKALVIPQDLPQFRVIEFNVNRLKITTSFLHSKFLVYNESYHHNWKVYVNGNEGHIYRANIAFKGVVVPPGKNTIEFRYEPWGGTGAYIALILYFHLFLLGTVIQFLKKSENRI